MSAEEQGPVRRSSHVPMPVVYAAVGASQNPDLLRFPPEGFTPFEEVLRLGSGSERFTLAASRLMTWAAARAAGFEVRDIERGAGDDYAGIEFDDEGQAQVAEDREEVFGPDGSAYLNAGTEATMLAPGHDPRRVRVVYTVDESRAVGFAWGTSDEAGAVGEQRFVVEWREDGSVWAVTRGFLAAPKSGLLGIKGKSDVRSAIELAKKHIGALAPGVADAAVPGAEGAAAQGDAAVAADDVADTEAGR